MSDELEESRAVRDKSDQILQWTCIVRKDMIFWERKHNENCRFGAVHTIHKVDGKNKNPRMIARDATKQVEKTLLQKNYSKIFSSYLCRWDLDSNRKCLIACGWTYNV